MLCRSRSSRIAPPPPEPISVGTFHRRCGKFCEELTVLAGKCLFLKRFFWFELECSNRFKPVGMNGLACTSPNCNSFNLGWLFGAEFDTISTVREVGRSGFLCGLPRKNGG